MNKIETLNKEEKTHVQTIVLFTQKQPSGQAAIPSWTKKNCKKSDQYETIATRKNWKNPSKNCI